MPLTNWQKWAYYAQWTIAAGAAAQCFETAIRLHLTQINPWFYVLIFSCTLLQYMAHFNVFSNKKPINDRQSFFAQHQSYLFFQFVIGAFIFCISFLIAGIHIFIPLLLIGVLAGAYSFFLLRPKHYGIFKYNGLFKIITLTISWAAVTGILPVLAAGQHFFQPHYWFHFAMRWLMMVAICLPFDVRDVHRDKLNGTITLPAIIGVKNAFRVCYVCIFLNIFFVSVSVFFGWNIGPVAITNAMGNIIMAISIYYSATHINNERSWFLLDANFIIHALIVATVLLVQ